MHFGYQFYLMRILIYHQILRKNQKIDLVIDIKKIKLHNFSRLKIQKLNTVIDNKH